MQLKKANEIEASYGPSTQSTAVNWEVSILWKPDPSRVGSPFTGLNRVTKPGGRYPRIRLVEGTMEYLILDGSFRCNNVELTKGDYVRFEVGDMMDWTSDAGIMMIVLNGIVVKSPTDGEEGKMAIIARRVIAESGYVPSAEPVACDWFISRLWPGGWEGVEQSAGPFTYMNRALPGGNAVYPAVTLVSGSMEYYILSGEFRCSGEVVRAGDYVRFDAGKTMRWSSIAGGEFFFVLNGEVKWHATVE